MTKQVTPEPPEDNNPPSPEEFQERLADLENLLVRLQDYTVAQVQALNQADWEQKDAIRNTQQVLLGHLEKQGFMPKREPQQFLPISAEETQHRIDRMRSQALGNQDQQGEQSGGGSTSGGSQLLRSMKR